MAAPDVPFMSVLPRASDLVALVLALWAGAALADPPARVVSMNLCTDQLLMLLGAPDQIVALSHIAQDGRVSPMAEDAARYPVNHGQGEEIFALSPDLVLAGTYSSRFVVNLLRGLGIRVEELPITNSLDEIPGQIRQVGDWLGRGDKAEALVARFEADLAALRADLRQRPRAVLHYANNYTSGDKTLAHQVLLAAGFTNAATEAGIQFGGTLPMERLILLAPDLVISGEAYPGASRAEEVLHHPAMAVFKDRHAKGAIADADWVCGTPAILRAISRLRDLHPEGNG